jgi:hypothetical protein
MKYVIEISSGGMIYIPNFMMIGSGIQIILSILPQQFEAAVLILLMGGIYEACH